MASVELNISPEVWLNAHMLFRLVNCLRYFLGGVK